MAKITWDTAGERFYETGVDRGVLYVMEDGDYGTGVPWNGLTAVTESPTGAEANPFYADNIKYLNLISAEELGATIEAYTYPDEFGVCDGTAEPVSGVFIGQQPRRKFGLSYRTIKGNDEEANAHGYKIHLLYSAQAGPSEKAYTTVNESPEPVTFSWELTTDGVSVDETHGRTALITVDSTIVPAVDLSALEDLLYGTESGEASLPSPAAVLALFAD